MVNPALATAAIGVVPTERAGMASGINSTFRQVGIATGIAAWGALFEHKLTSTFREDALSAGIALRRFGGDISDFVSFGGARRTGQPVLVRLGEHAFTTGLNYILVIAAIVAIVGAVLSVVLVRPQDFIAAAERSSDEEPAPTSVPV
jgi:hypothetical protein